MIEKVSKVKQAILFACCLAATGCKQAPQATVESGYKVITLAPTDRTRYRVRTRQQYADAKTSKSIRK